MEFQFRQIDCLKNSNWTVTEGFCVCYLPVWCSVKVEGAVATEVIGIVKALLAGLEWQNSAVTQ